MQRVGAQLPGVVDRWDGVDSGPQFAVAAFKVGRVAFPNFSYMVCSRSSGEAVIIDPGWEAQFLLDFARSHHFQLKGVLLTHSHRDHCAAAGDIGGGARCPVFMSEREISHSGFNCDGLVPIECAGKLRIGSIECLSIATPGHTPGSMCFSFPGYLFSGDTLFIEGCGLPSGRSDGHDAGELFDSLKGLREVVPSTSRVFPGHKYRKELGSQFSDVVRENIYMQFQRRDAFVKFCNRPSRSVFAPPPFDAPGLEVEVAWIGESLPSLEGVSSPSGRY